MFTKSNKPLSKIGIGSYGIGGRGHRDVELTEKQADQKYIDAVEHTLNKGLNFIEISAGYGHGNSLSLFKKGLDKSSLSREDVFITNSLYPRDFASLEVANEDIDAFYEVMETDYADSTLITQSLLNKFDQKKVFKLLNDLLSSGKTRYVTLSNAGLKDIKIFKQEFGDKFFAHETHLSFEIRANQDEGVFSLCEKLGVKNIIWRPLRRNMTVKKNWELLKELSEKYGKTQTQIILNWIVSMGHMPMVMSANKKHIDENVDSTSFIMSDEDYKKMTLWRPTDYLLPEIDWNEEKETIGMGLVMQISDFEKYRK